MDQTATSTTSTINGTTSNSIYSSTTLSTTSTTNPINVSIPNCLQTSAVVSSQHQQTPILQNTSTTALVQPMIFNQSTSRGSATTCVPQQTHKMRKEIYRYTCEDALFAAAWSNKIYEDRRFRLVAGTLLDDEKIMNNKVYFSLFLPFGPLES